MDARIRSRSLFLSIMIHAAIVMALLFLVMTTPNPPFPEMGGGGGVLVNIGYVDEATGEEQPMSETVTDRPVESEVTPSVSGEERLATQETEEAPVSHSNKDTQKGTKPVKVQPTKQPTKPQEQPRTADPRSLYQGRTTASRSQGTGSRGSGDQGDRNGDPNSLYTGKGGEGGGQGTGSGSGTGDGEGPGTGTGKGGGVSFSLNGRKWMRTPVISDRSQETGKVVVDITVDQAGNVVSAIPGGRGSTTTSSYLFRLAKEAAMKAKFNASPEGADVQKGTITFIFVVQ
ncbi:MAG: hypothetical protein RL213_1370 [Bacteroidota bacterium]|jgi:outer membrane biosynthesis protein TonB